MSTTAKGDVFEQRVYEALAEELRDERLWASPRSAMISRKKAYHSRDRNADIITDVSIEVYVPGPDRPSLVWIFEAVIVAEPLPEILRVRLRRAI